MSCNTDTIKSYTNESHRYTIQMVDEGGTVVPVDNVLAVQFKIIHILDDEIWLDFEYPEVSGKLPLVKENNTNFVAEINPDLMETAKEGNYSVQVTYRLTDDRYRRGIVTGKQIGRAHV